MPYHISPRLSGKFWGEMAAFQPSFSYPTLSSCAHPPHIGSFSHIANYHRAKAPTLRQNQQLSQQLNNAS
jgi:hypothetical protein